MEVDLEGVPFFDLRAEQLDPHPKSKRSNGKTVRRDVSTIDAIVLHQAGIEFSAPTDEARARRALNVACHAMVMRPGILVRTVDLEFYMSHADKLNSRSLGLEVDGNYAGLIGRKPLRGKLTALTDEVVHAACMGVKLLMQAGRAAGCPIKFIFGHRQTDAWRQADPGQELWQRVVCEYAVPVLGLETRPTEFFTHRKGSARCGKPIPKAWDPAGSGRY